MPKSLQGPHRRSRAMWGVGAAIVTLAAGFGLERVVSAGGVAQSGTPPVDLVQGVTSERALAGGERHEYRVRLAASQFLHVVVLQKGIDVVATVIGPSGETVAEVDSPNGSQGPEPVFVVAAREGVYRLTVVALNAKVSPGRYEISITELRDATPADRARTEAERLVLEAMAISMEWTLAAARRTMAKYEESLPHWRAAGRPADEADALLNLCEFAGIIGEHRRSADYGINAASIFEAIGNWQGHADALNRTGTALIELQETTRGIETYERALLVGQRHQIANVQASSLSNLATAYRALGRWQKALEYQLRAQPFFLEAADPKKQAAGLDNLGQTYRDLGEQQKALDALRGALQLRRGTGDRVGESTTLSNLGLVYSDLGEYRTALRYYEQSLAIKKTFPDIDPSRTAASIMNMSQAYGRLGEIEKRRASENESLSLWRSTADKNGLAGALHNIALGVLDEAKPDLEHALAYLTEAQTLWLAVGNENGQASALRGIGKTLLLQGDTNKAADYNARALALCRKVGNRSLEASILSQDARIALARNDLQKAHPLFRQAIDILEDLRTRVAGPTLRGSYFAAVQGAFTQYIDVLMMLHAAGHDDLDRQALEAVERGRARGLLETLTMSGTHIERGVDQTLIQRQRDIQKRIDAAASVNRPGDPGRADAATADMDALLVDLEQVRSQVRAASPKYAALADAQPLSVQDIQSRVVDADSVLLEYSLEGDRGYLWAVTPTEVRAVTLGARADIDAAARRVYDLLAARNERPAGETSAQRRLRVDKAAHEFPAAASSLSDMILGPVAPLLASKRIVVVASGTLQVIPFAVLPAPGQRVPLMVNHEVVHLPSASAMAILRRERENRPPQPRAVAVIADPVFEVGDPRVRGRRRTEAAPPVLRSAADDERTAPDWERAARAAGVATDRTPLPRLRYTRDEAEAILQLAPPSQRLEALDFRASRKILMGDELARHRIIHIATHGFVNSERPELSGIALSMVDERGQVVDGFLRMHHIYDLRLPVELVVLSACQTALGQNVRGEGVVGLTRGFMYAGAARVVSSLWKVDDQATADLMKIFYQGMLGRTHLRPAAALRRADRHVETRALARSLLLGGVYPTGRMALA